MFETYNLKLRKMVQLDFEAPMTVAKVKNLLHTCEQDIQKLSANKDYAEQLVRVQTIQSTCVILLENLQLSAEAISALMKKAEHDLFTLKGTTAEIRDPTYHYLHLKGMYFQALKSQREENNTGPKD